MVEGIILGLLFLIVAVLSFAAGIYVTRKELIEPERIRLPELPPIKPKSRGAILRPLTPHEVAIKKEEEILDLP